MPENAYTSKMRQKAKRAEEKGRFEDALGFYRDADLHAEEANLLMRLGRQREAAEAFLGAEHWEAALDLYARAGDTKGVSDALGTAHRVARKKGTPQTTVAEIAAALADVVIRTARTVGVEPALRLMLEQAPNLSADPGADHFGPLVRSLEPAAEQAGLFDLLAEVQLEERKITERARNPRLYRAGGWREIITFLKARNAERALEVFKDGCYCSGSPEPEELCSYFNCGIQIMPPHGDEQEVLCSLPQAQGFYEGLLAGLCAAEDTGTLWACIELGRNLPVWQPWRGSPIELRKRALLILASKIPFVGVLPGQKVPGVQCGPPYVEQRCEWSVTLLVLVTDTETKECRREVEDAILKRIREYEFWGLVLSTLVDFERYEAALQYLEEIPLSVLFPDAETEAVAKEAKRKWGERILWKKKVGSAGGPDDLGKPHLPAAVELDHMFALGEITREEFERQRKGLADGEHS